MFPEHHPSSSNTDRPTRYAKRKQQEKHEDERPPARAKAETASDEQVEVPAARLVSVEILNGDDATVLAANGMQFVNLPREQKWVGGPVANIDRLGRRLRVRARFDRPGRHRFWVALRAGQGNAVYTQQESAHAEFACDLNEYAYSTGDDGTLLIDDRFNLPAAGGNVFWIAARDETGTGQTSVHVTTRRLVYCQELVMQNAPAAPDLAGVVAQLALHHITLIPLTRVALPERRNVDIELCVAGQQEERAALLADMNHAFDASEGAAKEPYVFIIAYVHNLALKHKTILHQKNINVGPGQPDVNVPVQYRGVPSYLWHGLDGATWTGPVEFEPNDGPQRKVTAEVECTAVPNDHRYPDQCRNIRVKVSGIGKEVVTGELFLGVKFIKKLLGGVSFGDNTPLICLATRSGWINIPSPKQQVIVLHEIGHKLGMVPDGSGKHARLPNQYHHTHVGSHCHYGLPSAQAFDPNQLGRCVMFGEALTPNREFCADCAQAVRKADLGVGWRR